MTLADQQRPRYKLGSRSLVFALSALGLTVLTGLSRWTLVEYLTPFIEPLLEIGTEIFFFVSLIWSLIHLLKKRRDGITAAALPLAVNLVTAITIIFVPFNLLTTNLNFRVHLNARLHVVEDVLAGKYEDHVQNAGGRGDLVGLPAALSSLSTGGGEIVRLRRQSDTLILFFDYRGILDSFSGFVYSTDDRPPKSGDFGGNFFEIDHLQKNWFWVSSRN